MTALLQVEGLHLHYRDHQAIVRAVDGVSFTLAERGSALGLVGESGSGKTSLALAIARLLPSNVASFGGRVRLQGQEISAFTDEAFRRQVRWRQLALMPQGAMNALNPVLRVGDQIVEPLIAARANTPSGARQRALDLLYLVGLPADSYDSFPHELSGGMKQRAMIASALVMSPALVLLDEPTSALDVSVQAQITNLLKRLKGELGLSLLFITHDIALASDVCDFIAVMYAGQLIELGSAEQVLLSPGHPYTRGLLTSIPRLRSSEAPRSISGSPPDLRHSPPGCRFHPRCSQAMDRCSEEMPSMTVLDGGHRVRCWLHGGRSLAGAAGSG